MISQVRIARGLTALLATHVALGSALAAETPTPPAETSWTDVLRLAREATPRLALERASVSLAAADRRTAGELPNPSLNLGREKPTGGGATLFDGDKLDTVGLEMPLHAPGLRSARIRAADQTLMAARNHAQAHVNTLAADAGEAFIELLLAQREVDVLTGAQQELKKLHDVVEARQQNGVSSQYDLLRLDVEIASWRGRLHEAQTDVIDRQAQLATLLGFSGWQPVATGDLRALAEQLKPDDGVFDVATHPAMVAAAAEQASAESRVTLAERERLPEISLDVDKSRTTAPFGASRHVGVSVEVPIMNRRQGSLDHARAEADAAAQERRLTEAELSTDIARSAQVATHRLQVLEQFDGQVAKRLPELKDMAEVAYRVGNTPMVELLDAARTRYEAQLEQAKLEAELAEARLDVAQARGALGVRF
ncbi:MAG TPA: TolC family protein [Gammaproteobacteria bacterium]|jgi:cobalt-zinc-cadmium efflux system outer membrane protein|nr:TolC family protein [Gammaproteobacteria bacterium]